MTFFFKHSCRKILGSSFFFIVQLVGASDKLPGTVFISFATLRFSAVLAMIL
jgi:hypothetical protein